MLLLVYLLLVSLFYYFQGIELFDYSLFIPLGIMFLVGVYDDFYNADFKLKFFLQIIVAKILIDQGYVISNYHGFFGVFDGHGGEKCSEYVADRFADYLFRQSNLG